jgi:hypothetical protein
MRVSWEELQRALAGAAYLAALLILGALAARALEPLELAVAIAVFLAATVALSAALARFAGLDVLDGVDAAAGALLGAASLALLSIYLTAAGLAPLTASLAAGLSGACVAVGASWLARRLKRGETALSSWMAEASPWLEG